MVLIWVGALALVVALWAYDHFVDDDDALMKYGRNGHCLLAGKTGKLYFVIVPTATMVFLNVGSTIFSIFQFARAQNKLIGKKGFYKLAKFMGRLVVFQSIQWGFAVIFFFTHNQTCKILLEMLIAYEGVYISISYFIGRVRVVS